MVAKRDLQRRGDGEAPRSRLLRWSPTSALFIFSLLLAFQTSAMGSMPAQHTGYVQIISHCRSRVSLNLRGGSDGDAMAIDSGIEAKSPTEWTESDVLAFVESMRGKFGEKTDGYVQAFKENDIDGPTLLALNLQKMESINVKSLGHREHLMEQIQQVKAKHNLMRGPKPGEFEAARAAEMAPGKNPPKLQEVRPAAEVAEKWESVERTAWDQNGKEVDYYVFLEGVGSLPKDQLTVSITDWSLEVRAKGLGGKNYMQSIPKLHAKIRPEHSLWKARKDRVTIKLCKEKDDFWTSIGFDSRKAERDEKMKQPEGGPEAGMIDLMKEMYDTGDTEMKQTIAKAWHEAREKTLKEPNLAGRPGTKMPGAGDIPPMPF